VEKQEQPKHWDSVKDLFGAALEVGREQRSAFLREACGSNESLRAEIESLLAAYENSSALSQSHLRAGTQIHRVNKTSGNTSNILR
jgi:hypothetical protein